MMMLIAAACRDHRQYPPNGDIFDIHREPRQHVGLRCRHPLLPRRGACSSKKRDVLRSKRSSSDSRSGTWISRTPVCRRHPLLGAGTPCRCRFPERTACEHRLLLVEQCTYEKSERILVQQGISCRITG